MSLVKKVQSTVHYRKWHCPFYSRAPRDKELHNCKQIQLTSDEPWDPTVIDDYSTIHQNNYLVSTVNAFPSHIAYNNDPLLSTISCIYQTPTLSAVLVLLPFKGEIIPKVHAISNERDHISSPKTIS